MLRPRSRCGVNVGVSGSEYGKIFQLFEHSQTPHTENYGSVCYGKVTAVIHTHVRTN